MKRIATQFIERIRRDMLCAKMPEIITVVDEFVLSLDSLVRIGGNAQEGNNEIDDYEKIMAALESAREKYGVHFEGDEANVLRNNNGDYIGSSVPVNIRGIWMSKCSQLSLPLN